MSTQSKDSAVNQEARENDGQSECEDAEVVVPSQLPGDEVARVQPHRDRRRHERQADRVQRDRARHLVWRVHKIRYCARRRRHCRHRCQFGRIHLSYRVRHSRRYLLLEPRSGRKCKTLKVKMILHGPTLERMHSGEGYMKQAPSWSLRHLLSSGTEID